MGVDIQRMDRFRNGWMECLQRMELIYNGWVVLQRTAGVTTEGFTTDKRKHYDGKFYNGWTDL
jgi:hypothetical protein